MDSGVELSEENPLKKANIFSRLFFGWMIPIHRKGIKYGLKMTDLYKALKPDQSDYLGSKLEQNWNDELKKSKNKKKEPSLLRALSATFFWQYMGYGMLLFVQYIILRTSQPLILAYLLKLFSEESATEEDKHAKMYISGSMLVVCNGLIIFLFHNCTFGQIRIGMRVRVAVSSIIYRKLLRLNKKSLGQTTAGGVVNLLSNDVSRFDIISFALHYLWISPFQIAIVTYFLWEQVGISSLAGVGSVILLTVPFQLYLASVMASVRTKIATRTDKRVKIMNEIIAGIQVMKMYAWEKPFEKLVAGLRKHEVDVLTIASYIRGYFLSGMVFTERIALFLTLLCYTMLGEEIVADKVYSLTQFYSLVLLVMAIYLPTTLSAGAETLVAIRRLRNFLLLDEIKESKTDITPDKVSLNNVSASWSSDSHTLKDINLEIPRGKLCAIIGPVGAGKSSLLQLLLGELSADAGKISLCGDVSYASQEPWLFVSTVRNNILFGQPYDKHKYDKVSEVCALISDFKQFPNGDKTLVGERGVSLSGGQRARINLARAIYRDADVYLLDDPLSAVDTHVGRHLFDKCIVDHLVGKTRILVTHQLQYLKKADIIIVLNEGNVEAVGTFDELAKKNTNFTKMLIAADESTEETKKAAKVLRQMSTVSAKSVEEEEVADQEVVGEEIGLQGKSAYSEYFKAAGNTCVITLVSITFLLAQVATSGCDYWVSYWTSQEEMRQHAKIKSSEKSYAIINSMVGGTEYALNFMQNALSSLFMLSSNSAFDNTTESTANARNILFEEPIDTNLAIYIYSGIIVALIVLCFTRSMGFFKLTMIASINLHGTMFEHLMKAPMRFFDTNPSGRILNRFSKDIGTVDELLPRIIMETLQIMLVMVGSLVMVAITNYYMIIAIVVFGGLFFLLRKWYLVTAKTIKHLEGVCKSPVFSHVNSSLNGITTIRAAKADIDLIKQFDHHQDNHTSAWVLVLGCQSSFGLWLDMITIVFTACVVYSFILIDQNGIIDGSTVGLAISQCLILSGMLQYGVRQSAEVVNQMASVERILQYTTLDEEGPFETPGQTNLSESWPKDGNIKFDKMSLHYAENEPAVLKDLDFQINSGEKIGIVGRTGAGKSSLISAIFRLAPLKGTIDIDAIDIKTIGLSDLRRHISIIPQEPVLFSATLRYNLDPFEEFDDATLWKALEEVELKDVASTLEYMVEEGGGNFSLGQRQLVCLARAILRNNKILLLDEATANVDPRTDGLIQTTIREKFADCTVLTIAHRLNTIMDSDKVLVMDKGELAEFDHPHNLLQKDESIFTGMVRQTGPTMSNTLRKIALESYKSKHGEVSDLKISLVN